MALDLVEITHPGLAYVALGGFAVAFSLVSLLVKEKLYINEVVLGTAFGIIMGPHCANAFNPRSWGTDQNIVTLEVMRIVLATGLFAIGVELPRSYMWDHAKGLLVMVVPTMAFGWMIVAAVIFGLFPKFDFISALVIAACLTPTDPIISAAIVGGKFATKNVPQNLRRILSAESAANDGLAYPFLSISIYLTVESSRGVAFGKWFLVGWLYQVILGTVLGAVLGLGFCHLMKFSYRKGYIDRESYVAQYLALALFTIGIADVLGSDDLLAAFACGSAISWDGHFNDQTEDALFSSVIDLLLNCACFIYIGAWLPFESFNSPELGITPWRLVVLFIAILVLRRIPPLLLLYRWVPEIKSWREAVFSGHFGPMGVGAIFVSTLAVTRLPQPQSPPQGQGELLAATIQTVVSFVVLGSIIIHGLSIPFFSFGRRVRTRTLSMSRTLTSTVGPDWLLWARRAPGPDGAALGTPAARSDVEAGKGAPPDGALGSELTSRASTPINTAELEAALGDTISRNGSSSNLTRRIMRPQSPGSADCQEAGPSTDPATASSLRLTSQFAEPTEPGARTPKTVHFPNDAMLPEASSAAHDAAAIEAQPFGGSVASGQEPSGDSSPLGKPEGNAAKMHSIGPGEVLWPQPVHFPTPSAQ